MSTSKIWDGRFAKLLAIVCGIVPGALLIFDGLRHQLGVNGVNFAIRSTGLIGLVMLTLALAITPARRLSKWQPLLAIRRNLGVYGFIYILAHFTIFFWWDRDGSIGSTIEEIVSRVYLWFGTGALVLMIPLTITSTDGMVTRLGAKKWKLLHRLTYAVIACGLVHYWLLVKSDTTKPLAFTIVCAALMATRFIPQPKRIAKPKFWKGELKLASIVDETHDAKTFRFVNPAGGPLPFEHIAGQYLNVPLEVDGARANRSYTIASPPTRRDYVEITVKKSPQGNGGSKHIHATWKAGDTIKLSAPAGKFFFKGDEAKRIVLLAGGVGITPAMSVIRALTDRAWKGDIYLAYAVRTKDDVIFAAELESLQKIHSNLHVDLVISSERGHITKDILTKLVPDFRTGPVMMCGPLPMMAAMRALLVGMGIPNGQVHEEEFISTAFTKGEPAAVAGEYDVKFARAAKTAEKVSLTVLEAAEECGIEIPYECRSGICGQCKTKLVSGTVSMEIEDALTAGDRGKGLILACQARPTTAVVIDA